MCICNKSLLVWVDTIDYYIGSYIGIMLVVKFVVQLHQIYEVLLPT